MTLMVALVGEQPLPNLIPVRSYNPDSVLLVYSERTKGVYERLKAVLESKTVVYELKTDAYNIVAIIEALNAKLKTSELQSQTPEFNLTGGTKLMSLAAYQVAQQTNATMLYIESEGKRNRVYRYTWKHNQLQPPSQTWLSDCKVSLQEFFDVQLGIGNWKEHGPAKDKKGQLSRGGFFEKALADTLRKRGTDYEIMAGVKALKDQIDIDIAIRYENQFGILEAKVGDEGKTLHGIQQLSTAAQRQMLGTYTKKFYAITVSPSPSQEFLRKEAHIQIIQLPGYDEQTHTLSEDDMKTFIEEIDKAFKE